MEILLFFQWRRPSYAEHNLLSSEREATDAWSMQLELDLQPVAFQKTQKAKGQNKDKKAKDKRRERCKNWTNLKPAAFDFT